MIPATLSPQVQAFGAAVTAARPLASAPRSQIAAALAQGNACLTAINAAQTATGQILDGGAISPHPALIASSVVTLGQAADDAVTLSDLRGFLGRAVFNLAQA